MTLLADASQLADFWLPIASTVVAAAVIAVATFGIRSRRVPIWAFCNWTAVTSHWRLSTAWRRRRVVLAGLIDYVRLLAALRSRLVKYCRKLGANDSDTAKPTILIRVYTRQLPSNWPVWDSVVDDDTRDMTPLERYAYDLRGFINAAPGNNHDVEIRRVIVIDSCQSPDGKERFAQLEADVRPKTPADEENLKRYISLLHTGWDDASYLKYKRPWPGWLADIVFYGIKMQRVTHWLWAVTSSFDAQEDLVLLRLHSRLDDRPRSDDRPLPGRYRSLSALARDAGDLTRENMHALAALRRPLPDESTE